MGTTSKQSVSIDVEVKKSLFCAYLPAKIISFQVLDEKLEWGK